MKKTRKKLEQEILELEIENDKLKKHNADLVYKHQKFTSDINFYRGKYEAILELTASIYSGTIKITNNKYE